MGPEGGGEKKMKCCVQVLPVLVAVVIVPANASWVWEYNINYEGSNVGWSSAITGVGHSRAGAVLGEDSFFFVNSGRPVAGGWNYGGLIFNNCTGATDIPVFTADPWVNPLDASDVINLTWCWGVAADVANNQLFLSNQDTEYSILVYDLTGAPTQWRNELGFWTESTYYPSQINLDGNGNIFIANYGMSWIPDGSPAVGNICWYPAIASDPDWATEGADPHNPALMGIYSAIRGATQAYPTYTGAAWICEGVDVSDDGSILVYTSRGGPTQGVYVAVGSPVAGYVLTASNNTTLLPWFTTVTGDFAISNVRGCALAPDDQHVFFCVNDPGHEYIFIWNWIAGYFIDPIPLAAGSATYPRIVPSDRSVNDLPYDVDVYSDAGRPCFLNVLVSPYYRWEAAAKFTGYFPFICSVDDWSLY